MDKSSVAGAVVGVGGIVTGLLLEGGRLSQIIQPTAAMIVFGGTLGAVLVQFPLEMVLTAISRLRIVLFQPAHRPTEIISTLVSLAMAARKAGMVSLDKQLDQIDDAFVRKAVMLAVDGTEPIELRKIMQCEMESRADYDDEIARVYESAGGFSPTIGIIGAVLGLIQVMQHLGNIDEVGRGIAVAFVATIYGVAAANLFCIPVAGKLRLRSRQEQLIREIALEGVISILEGMNPRMLEIKLRGFLHESSEFESKTKSAGAAA